jgi:hypothetical protein
MCCCCCREHEREPREPDWIDWPEGKKMPKCGDVIDAGELGKAWVVATRQNQWNASSDVIVHGYRQIQVRFVR